MVWASSFSAQRLLSSEIYRASSYSSRQKLSGIQPYLKAKLDRPASRISSSRSNTQLRPYLKERTMAPFRRYRRIHSYLIKGLQFIPSYSLLEAQYFQTFSRFFFLLWLFLGVFVLSIFLQTLNQNVATFSSPFRHFISLCFFALFGIKLRNLGQ